MKHIFTMLIMLAMLAACLLGCGQTASLEETPSTGENTQPYIPVEPPATTESSATTAPTEMDEGVEEPPMAEDPDQQPEEPEWPKVELVYDSDGNVIKKTVTGELGDGYAYEYTPEGHEISYTEFFTDGTVIVYFTRVYHGTDPLSYTETNEWGDTYEIVCNENDEPVFKSYYTPDGSTFVEEWMQGEQVTRRRTSDSEGNVFDAEYVDGVMVKEYIVWESGMVQNKTYENEYILTETFEWIADNGDQIKETKNYTDGVLVEEIVVSSSGSVDINRYTNGVKTYHSGEFSDGTYEILLYNDSGLLIYQEAYVAAWNEFRTTEYTVGSNGLYTYSIYKCNDGYQEEVFYDANGNKASWKSIHSDGSLHQGVFDADGKYIEQ